MKPNPSKVKYPVKRKSKITNRCSKENDKKGKKLMRDNINDERKEHLKKEDNKKKESLTNLMVIKKNSRGNTKRKERKLWVITWMMRKKNI